MISPDPSFGPEEKVCPKMSRRTVSVPCYLEVELFAEDGPQAEFIASEFLEDVLSHLSFKDVSVKFGGFVSPVIVKDES